MDKARVLPNPQAGDTTQSPVVPARQDGTWRVVSAAVRGVSHDRLDLPCQDAVDWFLLEDGTLVIALADGAGSARYADLGARLAVDAALRWLVFVCSESQPEAQFASPGPQQAIEDETVEGQEETPGPAQDANAGRASAVLGAFESARAEVLQMAEEAGESAREYACTLTCVITDQERLVVAQIGDGAVVAGCEEELFSATRLQRGEYANETHFLCEEDALDQVVVDIYDHPVDLLAVMSDGLIRLALKMPSQEPHAPFFAPLFRFARQFTDPDQAAAQLADFLASERVNARTDDDKSLVLAVRQPSDQERGAA